MMFTKKNPTLERIEFRIINLRKNCLLGQEPIGYSKHGNELYSNCHGTTAFIHGFGERNSRPEEMRPENMSDFLLQKCQKVERDFSIGGIAAFWSRETGLQHTATVTELKRKDEKIFHQADVGERFTYSTRNRYIETFFGIHSPSCEDIVVTYHQLK